MRKSAIFATTLAVLGGLTMLGVFPLVSAAQQEEPTTHILTITSFTVPRANLEEVNEYVDEYIVAPTKADPYVLSFRYGTHLWGGMDPNVWLIAEYESLTALDESTEWQEEWFEEHYPEGSAARDAADVAEREVFLPYFTNHTDNILTVNMNRAK